MKTLFLFPLVLSIVFLGACNRAGTSPATTTTFTSSTTSTSSSATGYQYWKGGIPNSFDLLDIDGNRAVTVTGKTFMVILYNKTTSEILNLEFGLSEVTQQNYGGSPQLTFDATAIDFHEKLGLKSPVALLVSWASDLPDARNRSPITNGFQTFSFQAGYHSEYGGFYSSGWTFTYNNVSMVGGVKNIDQTFYFGEQSANNAFNLLKQ